ncbi:hypothetical protein H2200_000171 [Cladophialophora chaetospira]|uniref:NTF2-like domain-containing protein n=1 Tax=Cladophialophora chaetospira TaxID=386627 RepID=A0AA38XMW9_9EURO|nr:hypothetical protein H2200_000171 [Cladophialophora chaetospira]
MRFSTIAPVALAALASAAPTGTLNARSYDGGDKCIPYDVAIGIETAWISTLTNFDLATAQNLLYPGLVDNSASIQLLAGGDLNAPIFTSAQAYEGGQGSLPPIGFTVLDLASITCDGVISLRWVADVGTKALPVHGITILKSIQVGTDEAVGPNGWQLKEINTEFNSAAWLADIGGSYTLPPPPTTS